MIGEFEATFSPPGGRFTHPFHQHLGSAQHLLLSACLFLESHGRIFQIVRILARMPLSGNIVRLFLVSLVLHCTMAAYRSYLPASNASQSLRWTISRAWLNYLTPCTTVFRNDDFRRSL